jgi:thioredoxin-dependent peroxiredoxin
VLGEGDKAPGFALPDQNGEKVKLSDLKGETVVLYFYPRADSHGWQLRYRSQQRT